MKDTTQKISLDDFISKMERDVKFFREFWDTENKKDPKNWPLNLKMGYGDWLEHFLTVIENVVPKLKRRH